jgi:hypothetical protein
MAEEKKDSGFVVKDKRIFAEGNEVSEKEKTTPIAEEDPKIQENLQSRNTSDNSNYPPINFTNFVLSLSTSALFHFGDFSNETGGPAQKNLSAAKQTIDILDMLNEKTQGNLSEQENNLIRGVLYELKLRYVKENG